MAEPLPKSVWDRRWLIIKTVLLYSALVIGYIVVNGDDNRLNETLVVGLIGLSGSVILGYLGFATIDDNNFMKALNERDKEK